MKRTELKRKTPLRSKSPWTPGGYSAGGTPANELGPPPKGPSLKRTPLNRSSELRRKSAPKKAKAISPASKEQRKKVLVEPCVVTGFEAIESYVVDPAHLCPRSHGGCDDPLCVVPLLRTLHRDFDDGKLDLLPYLVGKRTAELQHALGHYDGDLLSLLHRLTGQRFSPANDGGDG